MITKEKVTGHMKLSCLNCSKLPIEERYIIFDCQTNAFGNYGKRVFCSTKCMIKYLNISLIELNLKLVEIDGGIK